MQELGRKVGSLLVPNTVISLSGDLGSGKTTFVQGIARGLGIQDPIQSPTFVFMNGYSGTLPLFHFDLYRMKGEADFLGLGFDEYFSMGGVCAIEWPDRIPSLLPEETLHVSISHYPEGRLLKFIIKGDELLRRLEGLFLNATDP